MNRFKVLVGILMCIFIISLLNDMIIESEERESSLGIFVKAQDKVEIKSEFNINDILSEASMNDTLTEEDLMNLDELNKIEEYKKTIDEASKELNDNKLKYETILSELKSKIEVIKQEILTLSKEEELLGEMIQDLE